MRTVLNIPRLSRGTFASLSRCTQFMAALAATLGVGVRVGGQTPAARVEGGVPSIAAPSLAATVRHDPSPSVALALSALGTAVPMYVALRLGDNAASMPLVFGGAIAGPSLGYFYGRRADRGLRGVAFRTLAAVPVAVDHDGYEALATGMISGVLVLISDLRDIYGVGDHVRDGNERRARVAVMPFRPRADGGVGIVAHMEF